MNPVEIPDHTDRLIELAFQEDQPQGDITTDHLEFAKPTGRARLLAKEDLVVSGVPAFEKSFLFLDDKVKFHWQFSEGDLVLSGQCLATIHCSWKTLLKAERIALNFLGHLSGIATLTRCFVEQLEGSRTRLLDTRKKLPGYRCLAKAAVRHGGGTNHRMSLSDAVMIKDNHIALCGGMEPAFAQIKKNHEGPIEIEAESFEQVQAAVELGVQRVLLDNMNDELLKQCLDYLPQHIESEVSGGVDLERLPQLVKLGPDFISVGNITHSAPNADISMKLDEN